MSPIDLLDHPDDVCESEYRAIYECLSSALKDVPNEDKRDHAIAILEELEGWAKVLKKRFSEKL